MKDSYLIAHMDELGRVTIPVQLRKMLGMQPRGNVRLYFDNESITLTAIKPTEVNRKIHEFKEMMDGNRNLTTLEYDKLCELLDKLNREDW